MKKIFYSVLFFFIFLYSNLIFAGTYNLQIPFIKNSNKQDNKIAFFTKTYLGDIYIKKNAEITYNINSAQINEQFNIKDTSVNGLDRSNTKVNFFIGSDKTYWDSSMETFNSVELNKPNAPVHVLIRAVNNNIEKIFNIKPNIPLSAIKVKLTGVEQISVNDDGELTVNSQGEEIKFSKPKAYQFINGEKIFYNAEYRIYSDNRYGFVVKNYSKNYPLYIDPLLSSIYIGGTAEDVANDIAIDNNGYVYITGSTLSNYFPVTKYGYDNIINGYKDVFVCKLDNSLNIISATFIGGVANDIGNSIAIDNEGNILITGETFSADFPVTTGSFKGISDVFVVKLNSALTAFSGGVYIGGSYEDIGKSIALEANGDIVVVGETDSGNFPVTANAVNKAKVGDRDIFAVRLNESLSILKSTFLGDVYNDYAGGTAVDNNDNIFITGANVQESGYENIFIYKLNSDLSTVIAKKKITGKHDDFGKEVKIDNNGNVYIAGFTQSSDFSVTTGGYDSTFNGESSFDYDGFIMKFDNGLNLLASTFIGGAKNDVVNAIGFAKDGDIYIAGYTESADFPVTSESFDTNVNGYKDIFIAKLSSGLTSLNASTFIGGSLDDFATSLAVDSIGNLFVTGYSESNNYPVTDNSQNNGANDVVLSKLTSNLSLTVMPSGQTFNYEFSSAGEWKLLSLPLDASVNVDKFYNVKTVWIWDNGSWKIWSPDSDIANLVKSYNMETFDELIAGQGFWVNSSNDVSVYFSGNIYGTEKFVISQGWNLVGVGKAVTVNDLLSKEPNIKTVWKWENGSWKIWSPLDSVKSLISQYNIETFTSLSQGEGFWINKQ